MQFVLLRQQLHDLLVLDPGILLFERRHVLLHKQRECGQLSLRRVRFWFRERAVGFAAAHELERGLADSTTVRVDADRVGVAAIDVLALAALPLVLVLDLVLMAGRHLQIAEGELGLVGPVPESWSVRRLRIGVSDPGHGMTHLVAQSLLEPLQRVEDLGRQSDVRRPRLPRLSALGRLQSAIARCLVERRAPRVSKVAVEHQ